MSRLSDLLISGIFEPPTTPRNALFDVRPPLPIGIRVRNLIGTGDHSCGCESWLHHWAQGTSYAFAPICGVSGCNHSSDVGGHVIKIGSLDDAWYIVPLCYWHNCVDTELIIRNTAALIPANVRLTCGR